VRIETPLQSTFRLSRVPAKIGDLEIPAGTTVMLIPAAANRDPRKFEAPHEFRLGRPNWRQHLAFGSGVHACAGAPLARAEARVSAERLLDRMSDIRISEKHHGPAGKRHYEYPETYMLRGVEKLYLEFDAAS
jgi:cytochrome P450